MCQKAVPARLASTIINQQDSINGNVAVIIIQKKTQTSRVVAHSKFLRKDIPNGLHAVLNNSTLWWHCADVQPSMLGGH